MFSEKGEKRLTEKKNTHDHVHSGHMEQESKRESTSPSERGNYVTPLLSRSNRESTEPQLNIFSRKPYGNVKRSRKNYSLSFTRRWKKLARLVPNLVPDCIRILFEVPDLGSNTSHYMLPPFSQLFSFALRCNPTWMRGNFGTKLNIALNMHAGFHCNVNEKSYTWVIHLKNNK